MHSFSHPIYLRQVVYRSQGRPLKVVVYRVGEGILDLALTPQPWAGRGLLGCRLKERTEF
jgi:hypothetical protein